MMARPELSGSQAKSSNPPPEPEPGRIRQSVAHYWHPVGSCALGLACDARGGVNGVGGLVVADGSLFPQTPRATTNVSIVVAALRIAEWLLDDSH